MYKFTDAKTKRPLYLNFPLSNLVAIQPIEDGTTSIQYTIRETNFMGRGQTLHYAQVMESVELVALQLKI